MKKVTEALKTNKLDRRTLLKGVGSAMAGAAAATVSPGSQAASGVAGSRERGAITTMTSL